MRNFLTPRNAPVQAEGDRVTAVAGRSRGRARTTQLRGMADQPLVAGLVAAASALSFVMLRLRLAAGGDISKFVQAASRFTNPARVPRGLFVFPHGGYDGQFYYRLALDPANLHRTAFGITMDRSYRFERIGYPALAWLASLGHRAWVPIALVAVNVLALGCIGLLGGIFARDGGRHALYGLLLASYFGFFSSLGRDLTEPVAAACLLGGLLACRRRRPVLAGLLLAYGALTRETVIIAVMVIGLTRLIALARRRGGPGTSDLAWFLPLVAFGAWQLILRAATGSITVLATFGGSGHAGLPFSSLVDAVRLNLSQFSGTNGTLVDIWFLEVATLAVFVVAAAFSLRSTTVPLHERIAFAVFVLELGVLTGPWLGFADLRQMNEAFIFAVLILLGTPRRRLGGLACCSGVTLFIAAGYQVLFLASNRL